MQIQQLARTVTPHHMQTTTELAELNNSYLLGLMSLRNSQIDTDWLPVIALSPVGLGLKAALQSKDPPSFEPLVKRNDWNEPAKTSREKSSELHEQSRIPVLDQIIARTPVGIANEIVGLLDRLDGPVFERQRLYQRLSEFTERAAAFIIREGKIPVLIADLDSDEVGARTGAEALLAAMGAHALPYLYSVIFASRSLEQRLRAERIVSSISSQLVEQIRQPDAPQFSIRDGQGRVIVRFEKRCLDIIDPNGRVRRRGVVDDFGVLAAAARYDCAGNTVAAYARGVGHAAWKFTQNQDRTLSRDDLPGISFSRNAVSVERDGELRVRFPNAQETLGWSPDGTFRIYRSDGKIIVTPPGTRTQTGMASN